MSHTPRIQFNVLSRTNVPLDEVFNICLDQLYDSELLPSPFPRAVCTNMICMAAKNVQFSFNDLMFDKIDGVAMKNPLGQILANIYVGYYGNSLLFRNQTKTLAYYRSMVFFLFFHLKIMLIVSSRR